MKRNFLIFIMLLSIVSTIGCACYSPVGFRNPCLFPGVCAHGSGGVVDYVDGGIDHTGACGETIVCETTCDPCTPQVYQNHIACGRVGCQSGYPCSNCIVQLADSVRLVGEAALSVVATPFLVVGNVLNSAGRNCEIFPSCGCGNEIYLGDNCYQSHDFVDPCSPCSPSITGCQNCSGTIQDGIQFENSNPTTNQSSMKKQSIIVPPNRLEQKVITTTTKQQIVRQPTYINQKGNIKQATYIVNQK
ncbi:MAG: hypothetical protein LBB88_04990 [Planctomycetaceae bacterium]|jgi:hypothetical protein|nr:hypothetical protein [Planctomycetaceae bacterium]